MRTPQRIALAAFLAAGLSGPGMAGSLSIAPTTLITDTSANAQAVTLDNSSDVPLTYQVEVHAWQQAGGADQLAPTRAVMASPTMLVVPPQSRRVVRLKRMSGAGTAYFQLHLRQVPPPMGKGSTGVQLRVDHHLKVAFQPASTQPPALTAARTAKGYALTNTGTTAARIFAIGPAGAKPWKEGALGWVLPGATMEFAGPAGASSLAVNVNLKATTVPVR